MNKCCNNKIFNFFIIALTILTALIMLCVFKLLRSDFVNLEVIQVTPLECNKIAVDYLVTSDINAFAIDRSELISDTKRLQNTPQGYNIYKGQNRFTSIVQTDCVNTSQLFNYRGVVEYSIFGVPKTYQYTSDVFDFVIPNY
jgi:hypothetical protein